ncbi:flightin isoform X1 [Neodiprion fabricii]|uniref:flightin isoform X1 n=1 Tax=Neodiprion fabricii TaxID=2872261 RepID=UPI001ED961E1|nr:flightin isoform X1 [Neodiprion fabricii]
MDTSETRYIYSCDVKTSSVEYPPDDTRSEATKMWGDEPAPWDTPDTEAPAATGEGGEGAPAADGAAAEEAPAFSWRGLPKCDPPKYTLHWVRPLFLNYDYLYDYRKNYYDDVIDFMDRRQRGIWRDTPRAQEWSERVLRSYNGKIPVRSGKRAADMRVMNLLRPDNRGYYSYHTRAYYSMKYQAIQ